MTDPERLTDAEIEEIRGRCEKTEVGPWAWSPAGEKHNDACVGVALDANDSQLLGEFDPCDEDVVIVDHLADTYGISGLQTADFIAHARTDIPRLLTALEEARVERDRYRHNLECLVSALDAPAHNWHDTEDANAQGVEIEMHLRAARRALNTEEGEDE